MIHVTIGAGVNRPQARRVGIKVGSEGVVAAVRRLLRTIKPTREGWVAGAVFREDYRTQDRWESQSLVMVDVDFEPNGKHAVLDADAVESIEFAIENEMLPGNLCYLTPRGFRLVFVLEESTDNREAARNAHRGAIELARNRPVISALVVDTKASTDIARLMYLPNAIVGTRRRDADVHVLRSAPYTLAELHEHAPVVQETPEQQLVRGRERMPSNVGNVLSHLDVDDYHAWVEVGMAMRYSFGDDAFDEWDTWGQTSDKYPGRPAAWKKWRTFGRTGGVVASWVSIVGRAREKGYTGAEVFHELEDDDIFEPPEKPRRQLMLTRMSDVQAEDIPWLWENRIPIGRLTLLSGAPGAAKSYLTHYMSSVVTRGLTWQDGAECEKGDVLLISCEDDPADTIRPRLDACGADPSRVHVLEGEMRIDPRSGKTSSTVFTLNDVGMLEEALATLPQTRLVVIDPIGSYFGADRDAHVDTHVRALLAPVATLARRHRVAVLLVAHTRKSNKGSADDAVLGSRGFTGIARAVFHLFRDPKRRERRLLLAGKSNIGREQPGLAFTLEGNPIPQVAWEAQPVNLTADDMAHRANTGQINEPKGVAREWLHRLLVGAGGQLSAGDVKETAQAAGIPFRSVQRAADELGVESKKNGFASGCWMWKHPDADEIADLMS